MRPNSRPFELPFFYFHLVVSARRRDLYLTTLNTHNRQTSMPQWVSNQQYQQAIGRKTHALERAATGTGHEFD